MQKKTPYAQEYLKELENLVPFAKDLVAKLGIKEGSVVADIGCGGGVLTSVMAQYVGQTGTMFAVDIDPTKLSLVRLNARLSGQDRVIGVLGSVDDPKLSPDSVDVAVIYNTCRK